MSPRHFAVNASNVPGPNRSLSVLGEPVLSVHSLAEVADRHAFRLAVISAGGSLSFGLCGDPNLVRGMDAPALEIDSEIERLGVEVAR